MQFHGKHYTWQFARDAMYVSTINRLSCEIGMADVQLFVLSFMRMRSTDINNSAKSILLKMAQPSLRPTNW